ncbi:hypothetical protein [Desnuesiella massiliensis]|uniref:hypothetical protein n=1 Tax=Desnuesiella massiliensis TaxID=1650662 RepID=UPI0006E1AF7F|nr:hypothetical protein [Desnuesiella massiliensis]
MQITSISMSYFFLVVGVLSLIFFIYFKFIVIKTSSHSDNRSKIVGNMKDPDSWRNSNNKMSYVSLFWAIVSIGAFIYLKFFISATLISIFIPFIYLAAIIISSFIFSSKKHKAS